MTNPKDERTTALAEIEKLLRSYDEAVTRNFQVVWSSVQSPCDSLSEAKQAIRDKFAALWDEYHEYRILADVLNRHPIAFGEATRELRQAEKDYDEAMAAQTEAGMNATLHDAARHQALEALERRTAALDKLDELDPMEKEGDS